MNFGFILPHHKKSKGSFGNWIKNAGEDTFKWTEKTVGTGINKTLKFADKQTDKITGIFNNPTFLIVAGVVVVGIIVLR